MLAPLTSGVLVMKTLEVADTKYMSKASRNIDRVEINCQKGNPHSYAKKIRLSTI